MSLQFNQKKFVDSWAYPIGMTLIFVFIKLLIYFMLPYVEAKLSEHEAKSLLPDVPLVASVFLATLLGNKLALNFGKRADKTFGGLFLCAGVSGILYSVIHSACTPFYYYNFAELDCFGPFFIPSICPKPTFDAFVHTVKQYILIHIVVFIFFTMLYAVVKEVPRNICQAVTRKKGS